MQKNRFYFSHDGNARNDDKLIAVRMMHGAEGYGIYFMIIERLLDSTDYMSVKDYNIIAFDLRVSADKIKSIIEDFGLFQFTEDGKLFYSESFINRMKPLDEIREKRRDAGLKSAEKRSKIREKEQNSTSVEQVLSDTSTSVKNLLGQNSTEERRVKENKGEENKGEERDRYSSPLEPYTGNKIDEFEKECLEHSEMWLAQIAKTLGLSSVEDSKFWVAKYFQEMKARDETKLSLKDTKSHCFNWAKIEIQKEKDRFEKQQASQQPLRGKDLLNKIMNIQMD